jgi:hypothetical protein
LGAPQVSLRAGEPLLVMGRKRSIKRPPKIRLSQDAGRGRSVVWALTDNEDAKQAMATATRRKKMRMDKLFHEWRFSLIENKIFNAILW